MIGLQGTSSAQSARQPAGASSAQSACQPVGTASAQSVIPTAYAMPQSVVLPIADTALLTARTLARYHFPEDEREQLKQLCTRLRIPAAIRSAAGSQRARKKKIDWQHP